MAALQGNLFDMLGISKQSWRVWKEVSLFFALLMELSWIAPWLHVLLRGEDLGSQFAVVKSLTILGILFLVFLRASAALGLGRSLRLPALFALLILLVPNSMAVILYPTEELGFWAVLARIRSAMASGENLVPNEFLVFLTIIFVWTRAIRWASADGLPSEMLGRFKLGFLMLVFYVFTFVWADKGSLSYLIYAFFFFAWMAMGSARLSRVEAHAAAGRDFFTPNWLLLVFAGLLLVALILALLGWGINAQFALVQQAALSLWLMLWGLIILLLSPIIIAISWMFQLLLSRIDRSVWDSLVQPEVIDSAEESIEELSSAAPPPFLQALIDWLNSLQIADWLIALRPVFLWGIIGLFLLVGLYYSGRRIGFWKALSDDVHFGIQREESDDWWRSLTSAWRNRMNDLRRSLSRFADPRVGRRLLAAARIRRVYAYLMELSAELGKARKVAQTPLEYIPELNAIFPHHSSDVNMISRAYMRVRYGELDETPTDVIEVDRAWLQLRIEGERIKKKRKKKRLEAKKNES